MSLIDYDNLEPEDLICQYIMEQRSAGNMLPFNDYEIIKSWVKATKDHNQLLLILDDIIPEFYKKHSDMKHPPSLKKINRTVVRKLKESAMVTPVIAPRNEG